MYKVTIYTDGKEDVKKVMQIVGLTPEPFPNVPCVVDLYDGRGFEISEVVPVEIVPTTPEEEIEERAAMRRYLKDLDNELPPGRLAAEFRRLLRDGA